MNKENIKYIHQTKQFCMGCGVCGGLCEAISIESDYLGHYRPRVDETKCVKCGKCVSVCPSIMDNETKTQLNEECWGKHNLSFRDECGYYFAAYEGYDEELRTKSASGGYCTRLLLELLSQNKIDSVYCACKTNDPLCLYVSRRLKTSEEIREASGSAYYPIEISDVLKSIRKHKERTAIVCLPCQATALREAMKKDRILKESICYIIGLVCGGMPGKGMIEYIARDLGCEPEKIHHISFREKDIGIKCNNVQIKLYTDNEIFTSRFHNGETFGFVYLNKILHNPACDICTDIFAEQADIVFGDAWLNDYAKNEFGTSICITRNQELDEIMKGFAKNGEIDRVIVSQKNVGLVSRKKYMSSMYRRFYAKRGYVVGNDNVVFKDWKSRLKYIRMIFHIRIYDNNRKLWQKYKEDKISFDKLKNKWQRNISLKRRFRL